MRLATINQKAQNDMKYACGTVSEELMEALLAAPPFPAFCPVHDVDNWRNLFIGEKVEVLRYFHFQDGDKKVLIRALFDDKVSVVDPVILDFESTITIN